MNGWPVPGHLGYLVKGSVNGLESRGGRGKGEDAGPPGFLRNLERSKGGWSLALGDGKVSGEWPGYGCLVC